MAEGVFLPEPNKNKLFRFLYNSDEMQWKTIHDFVAFFASCGIELTYYPQDTDSGNAETAFVLRRKPPEIKPTPPSKTTTEQMNQLKKDIKGK